MVKKLNEDTVKKKKNNLLIHHLNDLLILNIMIPRCSYDSNLLGVWEDFVTFKTINLIVIINGREQSIILPILCTIGSTMLVSASYNLHFPQSYYVNLSWIFQTTRIKMNCNSLGEKKRRYDSA